MIKKRREMMLSGGSLMIISPLLIGKFNHPNSFWKGGMVGHNQSRGFLEYLDDFLIVVINKLSC